MRWLSLLVFGALFSVQPAPAAAAGDCRVLEFDFTPAPDLQIVLWLEDTSGNYVDTLYITQKTGRYGLGNRPGMMEFNSAWAWCYGRRTTTFPVWAHRHGHEFETVVFQNEDDINLSHPLAMSSAEPYFCRPLRDGEVAWDTETCASIVYTDKGMLDPTQTSSYPPRSDVIYKAGTDDPDVLLYAGINVFDAVSRATPPGGQAYSFVWSIPEDLPDGDYVAWIEVNSEWDQNAFYDYPSPTGIPWSDYGLPYRGQPSVVYRVPFTLGGGADRVSTDSYFGYGDPDGIDGDVREPDNTITTDVDGSGASRLLITVDALDTYRFRVNTRPEVDAVLPGAPGSFEAVDVTANQVVATFVAPGNDGDVGTVTGYEIRYRAGEPIAEADFDDPSLNEGPAVEPAEAGALQEVSFGNLAPNTHYYFAVRAFDACLNYGPIATLEAVTPRAEGGEVDACFIATAAFGSTLQADVADLRAFRDAALRSHVAGELLVTGYYTFGPALADVIRPSDTLRRFARGALRPVVAAAREIVATAPRRLLGRRARR